MKKEEILTILGSKDCVSENSGKTAIIVTIKSECIDVYVTIPYGIHEVYFEAKDKQNNLLVKDWFDFYGDSELDDFQETLLDVADVIENPKFRQSKNGKAIEAFGYQWYYLFGAFSENI